MSKRPQTLSPKPQTLSPKPQTSNLKSLLAACRLERHYKDMQDIEFTIQVPSPLCLSLAPTLGFVGWRGGGGVSVGDHALPSGGCEAMDL